MEFFKIDDKSRHIQASPQLWIYFVASIVLTLVTLTIYIGLSTWRVSTEIEGQKREDGDSTENGKDE
jgi:hypothetical protein